MSRAPERNGAQLPPKRALAVELALDGLRHSEIAAELGVARSTVLRWFRRDEVAAELDRQRTTRLERAIQQIEDAVPEAVRVLREILTDPAAPPTVRLRAACAILDRAGVGIRFAEPPVGDEEEETPDDRPLVDLSNLSPEQIEAFARGRVAAGGGDVDSLPRPGRIKIPASNGGARP